MGFLGELSPEEFLRDYWQKKPLLVRQAIPGFASPVSPDAFMDLATRDDALVRLIVEQGGEYPWQLFEGPFDPEEIEDMPGDVWSMLIQEVDRMVPAVHDLWHHVSFLPNWRLDDIMVSLASPEGGVGAHIDEYDVFLVQGWGRRRWQIGGAPEVDASHIPDLDVRILESFEPASEWIVEPGDMLYLPPRFAHYGVALDPCMTFSLGCRAPSAMEFTGALLERALESMDPDDRYGDPNLSPSSAPGLLGADATAYARSVLASLGDDGLEDLVGRVITEPRRYTEWDDAPALRPSALRAALDRGARIYAPAPYQALYRVTPQECVLYLRGDRIDLSRDMEPMLRALTSAPGALASDIPAGADVMALLADLVSEGQLILDA